LKMSTAHDAPPPIPPKPNSQGRAPQNGNDINQLLNLIDEELTISQENYNNTTHVNNINWNQQTSTAPLNIITSPSIEPINLSHRSNRRSSEFSSPNVANLARRSSGTSAISNRSQQQNAASYNVNGPVNAYQQPSYNSPQYYSHVQQQPYNGQMQQAYSGVPYYSPYNYYSSFPRDLTSQGWPSQSNQIASYPTPSVSPSARPLPSPPTSNTAYAQPPFSYANSQYNYGGIYTPSSMSGTTSIVMPDFHAYTGVPSPHQSEPQNQTQRNLQPVQVG
jgi:hypothetical protein